jgi:hypothetical protein
MINFLFSCVEKTIQNEFLIEVLQQEFIQENISKLEYLSSKYDYIEESVVELAKGIFLMSPEKVTNTDGRINLVRTDDAAIALAKLILPSYPKEILGNDFISIASQFKNLWIVTFQSKKFKQFDFDTPVVMVVISKHTAEVVMISY